MGELGVSESDEAAKAVLVLGDARTLDAGGGGGARAVAASAFLPVLVRPALDGLGGRERCILRWSNVALPPLPPPPPPPPPPTLWARGNAALVGVPERDLTRPREFVASRLTLCSMAPLRDARPFELLARWRSSATVPADEDDSAAAEEAEEEEEGNDGVELLDLPRRMIDAMPLLLPLPRSLLMPSLFFVWESILFSCINRRLGSAVT